MLRRVILGGLLGWIVLIAWGFSLSILIGFPARINMRQVAAEPELYRMLSERIIEPGRYVCNPALTDEGQFPPNQPVFSILYGGTGHESAGHQLLRQLGITLLASLLGMALLAQASARILSRYSLKVLYFSSLGALIALFGYLFDAGLGGYPLRDAILLGLNQVASWTVLGLAVAWLFKAPPARVSVIPDTAG